MNSRPFPAQRSHPTELDRLRAENAALRKHQKQMQDDLTLWNGTAMKWQNENVTLYNEYSRIEKEKKDYQTALLKQSNFEHDRLLALHQREIKMAKLEEDNTGLFQDNTRLVAELMTLKNNLASRPDTQVALQLSSIEGINRALVEDNTKLHQYNEKLKATIQSSRTEKIFNELSISHQYAMKQNLAYLTKLQKTTAELDILKQHYHHVVSQVLALEQKGVIRLSKPTPLQAVHYAPPARPIQPAPPASTAPPFVPQQQPVHPAQSSHPATQTQPVHFHPQHSYPQSQSQSHHVALPQMTPFSQSPPQIIIPVSKQTPQATQHASSLPFAQTPSAHATNSIPASISLPNVPPTQSSRTSVPITNSQNCTSSLQNLSLSSPLPPAAPPAVFSPDLEAAGPSAEGSKSYSSLATALIEDPPQVLTATLEQVRPEGRPEGGPPAQAPPTPPRSFKSMSPEESIAGRSSIKRSPSPERSPADVMHHLYDLPRKRARLSEETVNEADYTEGIVIDASDEADDRGASSPAVATSEHQDAREPTEELEAAEEAFGGQEQLDDQMQVDVQGGSAEESGDDESEDELKLERDPTTGLYREEDVITYLFVEDDNEEGVLHCPFCQNKQKETKIEAKPFVNASTADLIQHYKERHLFALEKSRRSRSARFQATTAMSTLMSTLSTTVNGTLSTSSNDNVYDKTSSVVLLDGILQSFTIGLVAGQAVKYWADYRDDSKQKRLFVASLVLLSFLQTFVEDYKVWMIMICHQKWTRSALAWSDLFINGCICSLCQSFFIRRCWKMTGRRSVVLYPLSFLAFVIMILAILMVVDVGLTFSNKESPEEVRPYDSIQLAARFDSESQRCNQQLRRVVGSMQTDFIVWTSLSLFLDSFVACILVVTLWKSRAGTSAADNVVRQVISITFQSAVLPAISMIVAVTLHSYASKGNLALLFFFLTGKLYTFGVLRTLNSRDKLRKCMKSGPHDLGRLSLSPNAQLDTWDWHTSTVQQLAPAPKTPNPLEPVPDADDYTLCASPWESVATAQIVSGITTDVQFTSPRLDASERGVPRNRISSRQ
ncbi:hypothetical protein V5O48_001946 [Marasmius crinis-equi]|uniref:DUF6534 domain-containing protein n=1 Tax=Marasmius crinis-equi TaxID=585013 RepID=A0ABR3FX30_9AGAR